MDKHLQLIQIDFENGDILLTRGRVFEADRNKVWAIDPNGSLHLYPKVRKVHIS